MDPIETLVAEHRFIEDVLSAADRFARALIDDQASADDLQTFVRFIREFVDGVHHGKEETILFPMFSEHGFSPDQGPIAVMLSEHDEGRELVEDMDAAAIPDATWSLAERKMIVADVVTYAALLRAHIQKEDKILYPMARQVLSRQAFREMEREFELFDATHAALARESELVAGQFCARFAPKVRAEQPTSCAVPRGAPAKART